MENHVHSPLHRSVLRLCRYKPRQNQRHGQPRQGLLPLGSCCVQPHHRLLRHPLPRAACRRSQGPSPVTAQLSPSENSEQFRPKSSAAANAPGPSAVAAALTSRGTVLILSHPQKPFVQQLLPDFMPASSFLVFAEKHRNCFRTPHPVECRLQGTDLP